MRSLSLLCVAFLLSCSGGGVNPLPQADDARVLRTDFTDDRAWAEVRAAIAEPVGEFRAYVAFVDDRTHDGLTIERLLTLYPEGSDHGFIFLADARTMSDPEHPVLVVDLYGERGRTFRVIPSAMWEVENNLSLANVDWEDFAENTGADGIYRGLVE